MKIKNSSFTLSKELNLNTPVISIFNIGLVRIGIVLLFVILLSKNLFLPALLSLFIIITLEGARFWSWYSFKDLFAQLTIDPIRSFPDEELQLRLSWQNNKRLPVMIQWRQSLPTSLSENDDIQKSTLIEGQILDSTYIRGRSSKEVTYSFKGLRRGFYTLPSLNVTAWDGLGFFPTQALLAKEHNLLVYPRLIPLPELQLQLADFMGPQDDKRPFLLDPVRISGLRAYTPDMPSRLINWKLSAQKGQLLAKVLEPSSDLKLCITVDVDAFLPEAEEEFETALSLAATITSYADEQKIPFGFITNATRQGFQGSTRIPISSSMSQASIVLESLARLEFKSVCTLGQLFWEEKNNLPWGTTLIVLGKGLPFALPPEVRSAVWHVVTNLQDQAYSKLEVK